MAISDCLPASLQGPGTTITRVAAGLSGAGVYRVDANGETFILKVASDAEPMDAWRERLEIRRAASDARLAPAIVHIDEVRRAVLSEFVVDRSFAAWYGDPRTRDAAIDALGRTLRRVHALPLTMGVTLSDARDVLAGAWASIPPSCPVPDFVRAAVERVLAEPSRSSGRPHVMSHNDVNPTNLVYDGERILLLDWDTAGLNDPLYDLAAVSVFLRMDEATCRRLLAAHDDAPVPVLPSEFADHRRVAATMCCAVFLSLAQKAGHPGAPTDMPVDAILPLGEFYQQLRTGRVTLGTSDAQWTFGLALLAEGALTR